MPTHHVLLRLSLIVAAGMLSGGCGPQGSESTVSGNVTLDGAPLPDGTISVFPLKDGKAAGGSIANGEYSLRVEPGEYRVEISRMVDTGEEQVDSDYGNESIQKESIPRRYNQATKLRMKVTPDGEKTFDYQLESK